jgi:outer membrane immunogenic protein
MHKFLIAALLAGALATPAFAQDTRPPVGGFHVEAIGGYDSTQIQEDSGGGLLYGVGAGYDFRVGRAVLGIQAEATESTNDGCVASVFAPGDSFCASAARELFIGGRAGFMVGRNVLLYGTAGYTNARFRVDYDDGTAPGTNDFTYAQNVDGVRVGAGAEFGLGRNAFLRTELRYSNFEGGSDRGQGVAALGFRF